MRRGRRRCCHSYSRERKQPPCPSLQLRSCQQPDMERSDAQGREERALTSQEKLENVVKAPPDHMTSRREKRSRLTKSHTEQQLCLLGNVWLGSQGSERRRSGYVHCCNVPRRQAVLRRDIRYRLSSQSSHRSTLYLTSVGKLCWTHPWRRQAFRSYSLTNPDHQYG